MKSLTALFCLVFCGIASIPSISAAQEDSILHERLSIPVHMIPNYRNSLRKNIIVLSKYAKGINKDFIMMARNGLELVKKGKWESQLEQLYQAHKTGFKGPSIMHPEDIPPEIGTPMRRYLLDLDAIIVDNMFCKKKDPKTLNKDKEAIDKEAKKQLKEYNTEILSIEHCPTAEKAKEALISSARQKVLSHIDIDAKASFSVIPKGHPFGESSNNIYAINDARNMLIMLDTSEYSNKGEWLLDLHNSNFDVLIIDAFFKGKEALTKEDIKSLKYKKIGAKRLVLCRINLTVAEDRRYYWKEGWYIGKPSWLRTPAPGIAGGIITEYWNPGWENIIGNYFKGIVDLGFDGVMMEGLDNHKYFENLTPID